MIDGQWWEGFLRPLQGEGRPVEHLLTGMVSQPAAPLDVDVARLREMSTAKTEFLNVAAHEMRTPLSVILGYGSLLALGGLRAGHQIIAGASMSSQAMQIVPLLLDLIIMCQIV